MKNLNQYSHRVSILFNEYLQNRVDLDEFIQKLRALENLYKQNLKSDTQENFMWFKFSEDDTLVTTIDDLERDLSNSNRNFTLERMREAINLDNDLFIYYS
ncbi:hypothetical protein DET49_102205 [Salegentibacter sp. 24]|uniref:hypothetical protein n=1 Tax=Salegentibacter sp. 24 TaxID=2183986 RepID=UPI00105C1BD6|nr:hypothetical protein [Salegentibacter sp. 24]TDN95319.1 hypothetical protein DET49_102205 [Salegentibacter sp. 24]